jgi:hypothetical protein
VTSYSCLSLNWIQVSCVTYNSPAVFNVDGGLDIDGSKGILNALKDFVKPEYH